MLSVLRTSSKRSSPLTRVWGWKGTGVWREGTRRRKLQGSAAAVVWQAAVLTKLFLAPDLCQELFIKTCSQKHWSTRWLGDGREEMLAECLEELKWINSEQGQIIVQSWHIYSILQNVKIYKFESVHTFMMWQTFTWLRCQYQFLLNGESFITWTTDCMEE